MEEHPNVDVLRQGFEVRRRAPFNEADQKLLDALFTDDITWHGTGEGPWGRTFAARGKEEVFALFGAMAAGSSDSFDVRPDRIYADDDHGVIIASLHAEINGQKFEWTEAQIFRFEDGRLAEFWGIPDASGAAAALSMAGASTLESE
jgi:ketosteroid isomerase-like protein